MASLFDNGGVSRRPVAGVGVPVRAPGDEGFASAPTNARRNALNEERDGS